MTYGTHDDALALGEPVEITVNFNETVYLSGPGGNPTLTLDTGGTATYVSGSGTTGLKFSYTPAAGHTSADLSVVSLNLPINSNIRDTAGNDAGLGRSGKPIRLTLCPSTRLRRL